MEHFFSRLRGIPWMFVITLYLIIAMGLYNLYSATSSDVNHHRFWVQVQWLGITFFAFLFWGVFLNLRLMMKLALPLYLIQTLLLLAVALVGVTVNGSQRWIALGGTRIQPSEFAKFVMILFVARLFSYNEDIEEYDLLKLIPKLIIVFIPVVLILDQPDLGTSGIVGIVVSMQIMFIRIHWKTITLFISSGFFGLIIFWNVLLKEYQKDRIMTFLNPMADSKGDGYQILQSITAIGNGGLWGRGYMKGTQSHLDFLPERHTDFIFAVWAEEQGFVGSVTLIALFVLLIFQILIIAERCRKTFSSLLAIGVASFFLVHMSINVLMVMNLFPVVGAPLSLISYGGSHFLTAMCCAGLVVAVNIDHYETQK